MQIHLNNDDVYQSIYLICHRFRRILEEYSQNESDERFSRFPCGCCGDVTELLSRYIVENLNFDTIYVCGIKEINNSHAWLVCKGYILDLTADQFNEGLPAVFISKQSSWHLSWKIESSYRGYTRPEHWPYYPVEAWNYISSKMKISP